MPLDKSVELEFTDSCEHARFLEETSMDWLKYHFGFFPVVIFVTAFLIKGEYQGVSGFMMSKYSTVILFGMLLLVGLANLYNQTTARIGYVDHCRNVLSIQLKFEHRSYLSDIYTGQNFYANNATKFFYIWDFWSARVLVVSFANACALLGILVITKLDVMKDAGGKLLLEWNATNDIATLILLSIAFALVQFAVFAIVLSYIDKNTPTLQNTAEEHQEKSVSGE